MAGRARSAQRRQANLDEFQDRSWMKYIECELCHKKFCCNNNVDRKPRAKRYLGKICCSYCWWHAVPVIKNLLEDKTLKVKKPK
jgi:hypothetical protein